MPKSVQRCVTSLSVSSKVPSSSRNSTRSRADILPSLCWRSRRSLPPPSSASWSRFFNSASFCCRFIGDDYSFEGAKFISRGFGGSLLILEGFDTLADAEDVLGQVEPASLFQYGNELVELRPGVRAGNDDANGVKQFLALGSGLGFHFVNDGL